jgi:hypothetical protein
LTEQSPRFVGGRTAKRGDPGVAGWSLVFHLPIT